VAAVWVGTGGWLGWGVGELDAKKDDSRCTPHRLLQTTTSDSDDPPQLPTPNSQPQTTDVQTHQRTPGRRGAIGAGARQRSISAARQILPCRRDLIWGSAWLSVFRSVRVEILLERGADGWHPLVFHFTEEFQPFLRCFRTAADEVHSGKIGGAKLDILLLLSVAVMGWSGVVRLREKGVSGWLCVLFCSVSGKRRPPASTAAVTPTPAATHPPHALQPTAVPKATKAIHAPCRS